MTRLPLTAPLRFSSTTRTISTRAGILTVRDLVDLNLCQVIGVSCLRQLGKLFEIGVVFRREDIHKTALDRPKIGRALPTKADFSCYTLHTLIRSSGCIGKSTESRSMQGQEQLRLMIGLHRLHLNTGFFAEDFELTLASRAWEAHRELSTSKVARLREVKDKFASLAMHGQKDSRGIRNPGAKAAQSLRGAGLLSDQADVNRASRIANARRTPNIGYLAAHVHDAAQQILNITAQPLLGTRQKAFYSLLPETRFSPYSYACNYVYWASDHYPTGQLHHWAKQAYLAEQLFARIATAMSIIRHDLGHLTEQLLFALGNQCPNEKGGFDEAHVNLGNRVKQQLEALATVPASSDYNDQETILRHTKSSCQKIENLIRNRYAYRVPQSTIFTAHPFAEIWTPPDHRYLLPHTLGMPA